MLLASTCGHLAFDNRQNHSHTHTHTQTDRLTDLIMSRNHHSKIQYNHHRRHHIVISRPGHAVDGRIICVAFSFSQVFPHIFVILYPSIHLFSHPVTSWLSVSDVQVELSEVNLSSLNLLTYSAHNHFRRLTSSACPVRWTTHLLCTSLVSSALLIWSYHFEPGQSPR